MDSSSHGARNTLSAFSYRDWPGSVGGSVRRTVIRIRAPVASLARRLTGVTPDQWFLMGFLILFLVFFLVLLIQPSSVGRGGR
jgi:hypothetical protein